jgi:cytochrome c biogenesis protein CcmG, thiol:disulfide interchange protein DsbE
MAKYKPTTDRHQALTFLALAGFCALFFGYFVLPYADPAGSPLLGERAPDFTLPVLVGGEPGSRWSLGDQQGKVVVLDFWASWCAPCRAQAPVIERIARRYPAERVSVVGVNTADKMDAAMQFTRDANLSYMSVSDLHGKVADAFRAFELPTLVIIRADGVVSTVQSRLVDETELVGLIESAMNES